MRRERVLYQDKVALGEQAWETYEGAIRTCLKLYENTQDPYYKTLAFHYAEKSKSGALTQNLSDYRAKSFGIIPDALLELETSLKIDRSYYQGQIQQERAKATIDSAHEAVVEYFMGDTTLYAFLVSGHQYEVITLPKDSSLTGSITGFRGQVKANHEKNNTDNPVAYYQKEAHHLYNRLLRPVIDNLDDRVKRLKIIPDGELGYLPLEMLCTENNENTPNTFIELPYLFRQYAIQYGYSASLLWTDFNTSSGNRDQLLAFAPSYEGQYEDSLSREALGNFRDQVAPLYYNSTEVNHLLNYLPGIARVGEQASEGTFKQLANDYDILHLAMHAVVDDEDPMNSKLVFTQSTDSLEDGLLHAYELYDMQLPADLVVLSACETGYGQLARGEGIMSLARAFSYAGCPSVVMSHWSINDASTAKLMEYFYAHLAEGLPKDVALCLFHLKSIPGFQFKSIPLLIKKQYLKKKGVPLSSSNCWRPDLHISFFYFFISALVSLNLKDSPFMLMIYALWVSLSTNAEVRTGSPNNSLHRSKDKFVVIIVDFLPALNERCVKSISAPCLSKET
jgi:CHAT domain-containing protein